MRLLRNRQGKWNLAVAGLGAAFLLATFVAGVVVHLIVRDLATTWSETGLNPFQGTGGSPDATLPAGVTPQSAPPPAVTPHPWDGSSRVTILVMGLDYRDWLAGEGAPRSDTMMLVTVDPITHTAGMLSIPRDLWVQIPGFDHNRINTAYMLGEAYRLPGGGPQLAVQTVENLLGVPIQYYAVIDFYAFERMIDEIGGIDVLVTERIKISPLGRDSYWLEPKAYHLDGADALAYARVRKAAGDDFGRAQRQQQVVMAILDRVTGLDMVPTLIAKAPRLYQELASGLRTNLSLDQMVSLGWLVVQIPKSDIRSGVISPPSMVRFYTRPDGAQVLGPVPDQIRILTDSIFVTTSGLGPYSSLEGAATPTP